MYNYRDLLRLKTSTSKEYIIGLEQYSSFIYHLDLK